MGLGDVRVSTSEVCFPAPSAVLGACLRACVRAWGAETLGLCGPHEDDPCAPSQLPDESPHRSLVLALVCGRPPPPPRTGLYWWRSSPADIPISAASPGNNKATSGWPVEEPAGDNASKVLSTAPGMGSARERKLFAPGPVVRAWQPMVWFGFPPQGGPAYRDRSRTVAGRGGS